MLFLKSILFTALLYLSYFYIYIPYKYNLPISDHSDGKKFYNLNHRNETKQSFGKFLKWLFEIKETRSKWPKNIEIEKHDNPPSVVINKNDLRVSFVNHASFLIQTNGVNIITDPIYSNRASMFPGQLHEI